MRLLIDQLVIDQRLDVLNLAGSAMPGASIDVFDFLTAPVSLAQSLAARRPDVVIVHRVWLHAAYLLKRLLDDGSGNQPRIVVASPNHDRVLQLQLAHHHVKRSIDLTLSTERLELQLIEAGDPDCQPNHDQLLDTVPLPPLVSHLSETASDSLDHEILSLVCVGMRDAAIAEAVHASSQTVKNRISMMLMRSGLRNRTQLAVMYSNYVVADSMIGALQHPREISR